MRKRRTRDEPYTKADTYCEPEWDRPIKSHEAHALGIIKICEIRDHNILLTLKKRLQSKYISSSVVAYPMSYNVCNMFHSCRHICLIGECRGISPLNAALTQEFLFNIMNFVTINDWFTTAIMKQKLTSALLSKTNPLRSTLNSRDLHNYEVALMKSGGYVTSLSLIAINHITMIVLQTARPP